MKNIGVICEYNPFHNGHAKQLTMMKEQGNTVCLMSGSYVQRGEPALLDKYVRARAAVLCGADLVLELPLTYALRSAEGFAAGGVEILSALGCVNALCFGSETGDAEAVWSTAETLLTEEFSVKLRSALASGVSFPAARQNALEQLGGDGCLLEQPNDILAVEYCKAIMQQKSPLRPMVLHRDGSYHESADRENPSATVLRERENWEGFLPPAALELFSASVKYRISAGERAYLAILRALPERAFEALPFGTEGLWRKVMNACRTEATLEGILAAAKSKRYTRTRLTRMLLCAFLGISEDAMKSKAPYVRVLALNETGQRILHTARRTSSIPIINAGETPPDSAYAELERRAADLYGLFADREAPMPPNSEAHARVVPIKER